jgi:glycosyltransferase involved in cell wall biosynthesis
MLEVALAEKADLTIVHSEAGLWVADMLLRHGYPVGIDFEDWFTEDLPKHSRRERPVRQMRQFEQKLAETCTYCLCTSHAVAREMENTFSVKQPTVIYNSFPWSERASLDEEFHDRKDRTTPSLHWFSQTIGKGRGLESLFLALTRLEHPVQIHLRGNCSDETREWIKNSIPFGWHDKVFIHPTVPNDNLLSRISEHDIGLAIESNIVKNKDLTVTNKLFQYMLGGLAVIATATAGQTEIMSQWASDEQLVPCDDPNSLAEAIDWLLESKENLQASKTTSLQATRNLFSWEHQIPLLERLIDETLARRSEHERG